MAKTLIDAFIIVKHDSGDATNNVVRATVECPVSEFQALLDLAGLTNAVPSKDSDFILLAGDDGPAQ